MSKPNTKKIKTAATKSTAAKAPKSIEASVEASIETVTAYNQGNVDALVASSKIASKAAESIGAEIAAYSKKSYDDGMAAAKEMSACKSVSELFEKQTEIGRASVEGFVTGATQFSEMYAAVAKEIFAPLNVRVTATAGIIKDYRI